MDYGPQGFKELNAAEATACTHACMQISGSDRKTDIQTLSKFAIWRHSWFASRYFLFLSHLKLFTFTEVAKIVHRVAVYIFLAYLNIT